jgi:dihydrofolate reductase
MLKVKLFIATTIDGFIARENGYIDWLNDIPNPNNLDYGYFEFLSQIDTLVIGRNTYEEILNFGIEWPYKGLKTYVVTSNKNYSAKTPDTQITNFINEESIKGLLLKSEKGIWIVGGGKVITEFLNLNSIHEMTISIIPIILGKGIKLFPNQPKETKFELINTESFNTGIVNLTYKLKE